MNALYGQLAACSQLMSHFQIASDVLDSRLSQLPKKYLVQSNGNGNLIIIIAAVRTHEVRQTSDRRIKQESVIEYVHVF